MDKIADRLDELRSSANSAELRPGEIAQDVAVAIAAREQIDEHVARQLRDRRQRRILGNLVGRAAVADGEIIVERHHAPGASTRVTRLPKRSR